MPGIVEGANMRNIAIHTLSLALALAACGGAQDNGDDGTSRAAATSGWDATDACKLLDKAAVGAALGDSVTETSVAFVHQPSGAEAATSECTYNLQSGGTLTFMARRSPIADNTPEAIAQTRQATAASMKAFSDKPIEDIRGLGKAAFFVPGINQMNVFLDDERFVILTISSVPGDRAKNIASELVQKISN